MQPPSRLKLVFHSGAFAFTLPVASLIEVLEGAELCLDRSEAEPARGILGRMAHRGEQIGLVDLATLLGLTGGTVDGQTVLVLAGDDGPWGVLVERVEGIFPEDGFLPREIPLLLDPDSQLPYRALDLKDGEPLIQFDLARFEAWRSLAG